MIRKPRHSEYSVSQDHSKLAIIYREGSNTDQTFLSVFLLVYIILLGIIGQQIAQTGEELQILLMFIIGFVCYITLTASNRKLLYDKIRNNQGLSHPKFQIVSLMMIMSLPSNLTQLQIILLTVGILTTIDVIIQNQLHDYVFVVSRFGLSFEFTLPIFHIPFQRKYFHEFDTTNRVLKVSLRNKSDNTSVSPHQLVSDNKTWFQLSYLPTPSSSLQNQVVLYQTDKYDQLMELISEIEKMIELDFVF